MPEAVRAKLAQVDELAQSNAQLLQHVRSAEGRVAAMQRAMQAAPAALQAVAPENAPSKTQITSAAKNSEKWTQLRDDFPEWAEAMEEFVASSIGSAAASPGIDPRQVETLVQQRTDLIRADFARALEETRIESKHENWKGEINSTDFVQWFTVQTPDVRALADSPLAKDAIRMLDLYATAKTRSAADIKRDRSSNLQVAVQARPGAPRSSKTVNDLSPEELWNYEATQRDKKLAQRGF